MKNFRTSMALGVASIGAAISQAADKAKPIVATVAVAAMTVPFAAHAELDAAVTTGITAAKTDLLAVYAALTTAGVAVFVGRVIYRLFKLR